MVTPTSENRTPTSENRTPTSENRTPTPENRTPTPQEPRENLLRGIGRSLRNNRFVTNLIRPLSVYGLIKGAGMVATAMTGDNTFDYHADYLGALAGLGAVAYTDTRGVPGGLAKIVATGALVGLGLDGLADYTTLDNITTLPMVSEAAKNIAQKVTPVNGVGLAAAVQAGYQTVGKGIMEVYQGIRGR